LADWAAQDFPQEAAREPPGTVGHNGIFKSVAKEWGSCGPKIGDINPKPRRTTSPAAGLARLAFSTQNGLMAHEHRLAKMLLSSWPFPRGAGRLTDKFFSGLHFKDDVATARTTDGFDMNVMPNELIGRHLYLTGEFDRSTTEMLLKLAKPGDRLLDIGANVGYVSACFLNSITDSSVVAVEPQRDIASLLKKNLAQFGSRSEILAVAISDNDGTGLMEIDTGNRGASHIASKPNGNTIEVELWSGDRLFNGRQFDIIKIDAEGHEARILKACRSAIREQSPRAILFEDHTHSAAPDGEIGSEFGALGYSVWGIRKHLTRLDLVPIISAEDCNHVDYAAIKLP
jgi:FkbM family methyltransferase